MRTPSTIYLAEDDEDMRLLIALALTSDGYDVTQAKDGSELLELLATAATTPLKRPDVIVSDVLMPGYSGIGVLAALQRCDWTVPMILITARQDDAIVQEAIRLGASAVVRKPFDMDDLRIAILNVVTIGFSDVVS